MERVGLSMCETEILILQWLVQVDRRRIVACIAVDQLLIVVLLAQRVRPVLVRLIGVMIVVGVQGHIRFTAIQRRVFLHCCLLCGRLARMTFVDQAAHRCRPALVN